MIIVLGNVEITLIVHEICQAYFYGAVANNEQIEEWLDEGPVTYINKFLVEKNIPVQHTKTTSSIPIKNNFIKKQFGLC